MIGVDGKDGVTHREMLQAFDEVVREVKDELKQQGQENKFIGARVSLRDSRPGFGLCFNRSFTQLSNLLPRKNWNGIRKIVLL
jgi:hypothetical protein